MNLKQLIINQFTFHTQELEFEQLQDLNSGVSQEELTATLRSLTRERILFTSISAKGKDVYRLI